ncbi:hypothetical protein HNP52_004253 [Sphingomonas kyeonggiensis]|uniref:Uncharacterized protein n=1 Tax=Sphingomonas kyeonggiensis TaxID=1268553 RepID=A0A7W7NUL1_9SPHN|nr:hypothetical protein [Sphingomonas kyeonggiensis]MBB4841156.1 hypothetical protein [Sphingomonas kyeonggiensis]
MKTSTVAGRRYLKRFVPTMIAYVVVLFACVWALKELHPTGVALVTLSVLPALPVIGVIVVMGLYLLEETDEFQRQRIAACMLFGTGVLLAAVTIYGFLTNGGAIQPDPDIAIWGFPLWCGAWGIAQCVLTWRDRLAGDGE